MLLGLTSAAIAFVPPRTSHRESPIGDVRKDGPPGCDGPSRPPSPSRAKREKPRLYERTASWHCCWSIGLSSGWMIPMPMPIDTAWAAVLALSRNRISAM